METEQTRLGRMKITQIHVKTTHEVYTEDKHYVRYGPNDWIGIMYFDIISDEYDIGSELTKELEELFQVEMELERLIKIEI